MLSSLGMAGSICLLADILIAANSLYQCGAFGNFPVLDQKIEILQKNVAMTNYCTAPANEVAQQRSLVCAESTGCKI